MIGKIMMWLLVVLATLSICFGWIFVFNESKSAIISVSKVSIAAGEYLEKYLIDNDDNNRGVDLIFFGITWLTLAYMGLKTHRKAIKKINPFVKEKKIPKTKD